MANNSKKCLEKQVVFKGFAWSVDYISKTFQVMDLKERKLWVCMVPLKMQLFLLMDPWKLKSRNILFWYLAIQLSVNYNCDKNWLNLVTKRGPGGPRRSENVALQNMHLLYIISNYSNPFANMIFGPREKSCYSKIMLWKSATKNFYSVIISHYTREKCNHKKFQCYISLLMYIHTDKIFVQCIWLQIELTNY